MSIHEGVLRAKLECERKKENGRPNEPTFEDTIKVNLAASFGQSRAKKIFRQTDEDYQDEFII